MQKLWLKNFEFHINPATWNTAQDLVQAGAVRNLREIEKHFWVATVADDGQDFEVEVMITPQKIKAFTCECWSEGRRLMCAHIAAGLLKVRQFLEQKAEARLSRTESRVEEASGRLSVRNVLEAAPTEDLMAFVREYARRDRDFALALKTWFAGQVTGVENPYLLLLDAALPRQVGSRALSDQEIRRLRKTLADLEVQLSTAFAEGNAVGFFQIATAILQKITPVISKLEEPRHEPLLQYCQSIVQQMLQFPSEHLSPEFREKRRDFLYEYLNNPDHPGDLDRLIIPFLAQAATEDVFFAQISGWFDRTPFPAPAAVLHLFLAALARRNRPEAVVRVLQDYSERPAQVKEAITALYLWHWWEAVMHAGEYFLDQRLLQPGQRREVEDILLSAAEKSGDEVRQRNYLRQRYRLYGHEDIILRLKTIAGAAWPEERDTLLAELREAGDTAKLAPLLAAEGKLDELAGLLSQTQNLSTFRLFEDHFWPDHENLIRDYYINVLSAYLTEHFGRPASEYVRGQLSGLVRKGRYVLARAIMDELIRNFPERHTLPEELEEMFPKSKRSIIPSGA